MGDQDKTPQNTPTIEDLIKENGELELRIIALKEEIEMLKAEAASNSEHTNANTFEHDDVTYKIKVKQINYKGKIVSAQEILTDEVLRMELLDMAWENREEVTFNSNGIFAIVY